MKTPSEFQIGQLMHQLTVQKTSPVGPPPSAVTKVVSSQDQKKELAATIQGLETKLQKLEAHIKTREQETAAANPKVGAKKARTAKETTKPQTVAEKARIARENKKFAAQNQPTSKTAPKPPVPELKTLATKVRGQIVVAKQKLAAL